MRALSWIVVSLLLVLEVTCQEVMVNQADFTGLERGDITMKWIVRETQNAKFDYFEINFATGSTFLRLINDKVSIKSPGRFVDRLDQPRLVKSGLDSTVTIKLKNLNISDMIELDTKAAFNPIVTSVIKIQVYSEPSLCGSNLNMFYNVTVTENINFNITLCGNPAPNVTWTFDQNVLANTGNASSTGLFEHIYSASLENVKAEQCGKSLHLVADGYGKSYTTQTTIFVNATPDAVVLQSAYNDGSCITVTWELYNAGLCPVLYELYFFEANQTFYKNNITVQYSSINKIYTFCKSIKYITTANIRAIFNGNVGPFTVNKTVTTNPTPTTNVTPTSASSSSQIGAIIGGVAGAMVAVAIILVIIIAMMKRHQSSPTVKIVKNDDPVQIAIDKNQESSVEIGHNNGYEKDIDDGDDDGGNGKAHDDKTEKRPGTKVEFKEKDDQIVYAELSKIGGRTGPKPVFEQSHYAEVKLDEMGFPATSPDDSDFEDSIIV